ncbi:MAG: hypothetical protein JKY65_07510, partial [Planctomycetes bacterium]|nr:hypothetical protein [Planctomycetota bacterium]
MQEGTSLGNRFRLGPRMARGRRGELFHATDEDNGTPCQVEVIAASGFRVEDLAAELAREVTLSGRLPASCLGARGWGHMAPDILYVARQWLPNLRPFDLSSGSVEARLARLARLAERVQELHAAGLIHRDLSVLSALQTDQDVFLSGLRFAKAEGVEEPPPDARGFELSYLPCAAPEVLVNPEVADERADVFSLGVLLHMALCGQPPYAGPTLAHLVRQHEGVRNGHLPLLGPRAVFPGLSDELNEVCRRSILPEAAERTPSVATWLEGLAQARVGPPVSRIFRRSALGVASPAEPPAARPAPPAEPQVARPRPEPVSNPEPLNDPFASDQGAIPPDDSAQGWGRAVQAEVPSTAEGEPEEEADELSPAEALAFLEAQSQTVKAPASSPPSVEGAAAPEAEFSEPTKPEMVLEGRSDDGEPAGEVEAPPDEGTDEFEPLPDVPLKESGDGRIVPDSGDDDSEEGAPSWVAAALPQEHEDSEEAVVPEFLRPATASWITEVESVEGSAEESAEGPVDESSEEAAEEDPAEAVALDPADARAALDVAVAAAAEGMVFESGEELGELDLTLEDEGSEVLIRDDPAEEPEESEEPEEPGESVEETPAATSCEGPLGDPPPALETLETCCGGTSYCLDEVPQKFEFYG